MEKCVRFVIKKNGPTKVEAIGFNGVGCTTAVDNLLSKMQAVPVVEPEFTADYHTAPPELETENPDG
jgi:hypothetical protein